MFETKHGDGSHASIFCCLTEIDEAREPSPSFSHPSPNFPHLQYFPNQRLLISSIVVNILKVRLTKTASLKG
jgi:hypothetical protein